jgi:ribosome-binding factor A
MTGEVKRSSRVGERLREELAVQMRNLRDPRVAGVLISRVEMTDDLQLARVYVRLEPRADGEPAPDDKARRQLLKGMEAASPRLRREASRGLGLRYAPDLRFFYDEAPEAHSRIEELLAEIKREDGSR